MFDCFCLTDLFVKTTLFFYFFKFYFFIFLERVKNENYVHDPKCHFIIYQVYRPSKFKVSLDVNNFIVIVTLRIQLEIENENNNQTSD